MIYFVEAVGINLVKIGFTEKENVTLRFNKMVADSPVELVIIATLEGDRTKETEIHKSLSQFNVRGEWFALSDSVRDFLFKETRAFQKQKPSPLMTTKNSFIITQYRADNNLTLEAFGERFGVNKSTVLRWEEGQVPVERISEISAATGIPPQILRPDIAVVFAQHQESV